MNNKVAIKSIASLSHLQDRDLSHLSSYKRILTESSEAVKD